MKITARVMHSRLLMMVSQVVHPLIIRKSWLVMLAVVDVVVACQVEDAQQLMQRTSNNKICLDEVVRSDVDEGEDVAVVQSRYGPLSMRAIKDPDDAGPANFPVFEPDSEAGLKLPAGFVPASEVDYFKLYFSTEIVSKILGFTNA